MAFAAVRSLEDTINGLLGYSPPQTLRSALDHTYSLRRTLEKCSEGVGDMDEQIIIEAARKLEDAIELPLLSQPPHILLKPQRRYRLLRPNGQGEKTNHRGVVGA